MNNQEIGLVLQCILFIFTNIYWSHAKSLDVNDETSSADHGFYLHKKDTTATTKKNLANIESFRYYAAIRSNRNEDLFDGAIITPNFIVTSARAALALQGSSILVHVGTLSDGFSKGKIHTVKNVRIHPNHTAKNPLKYNIALLRVHQPFEFDTTVNLIRLQETSRKIRTKDVAKVVGYECSNGDTDNYGRPLSLSLRMMTNEECKNLIKDNNKTSTDVGDKAKAKHGFCAKLNNYEVANMCLDHVSGLVVANDRLAGIYSYTTSCNQQNCPVVYTKIYYHLDWIKNNSDVNSYISQ